MNKSDFKQIEGLLDKKLKPISTKLEEHDEQFRSIGAKLEEHDSQFKSINAKLEEHSSKLDALTLDMIDVQKKTDIIPDIHSMIKDTREEVDKFEQRVERLETAA